MQNAGNALSRVNHGSVIRGFKMLGLSVVLNGSESSLVDIRKLQMYKMSNMMNKVDVSNYDSDEYSSSEGAK